MSRYVRTIDTFYDGEKYNADYEWNMYADEVIREADTIEELVMVGDLIIVSNKKNTLPIIVNDEKYLKAWLSTHDMYKIKEIYTKRGNDYICVAKGGNLELVCNT